MSSSYLNLFKSFSVELHNSPVSLLLSLNKIARKAHNVNCSCVCLHSHSIRNILELVVCYIAGGKETRSYGVVVKTGQMLYECSMDGCNNSTENLTPADIIVIQRQTQTVRAIEARTGNERLVYLLFYHDRRQGALLYEKTIDG
jgi:hypothetical protein